MSCRVAFLVLIPTSALMCYHFIKGCTPSRKVSCRYIWVAIRLAIELKISWIYLLSNVEQILYSSQPGRSVREDESPSIYINAGEKYSKSRRTGDLKLVRNDPFEDVVDSDVNDVLRHPAVLESIGRLPKKYIKYTLTEIGLVTCPNHKEMTLIITNSLYLNYFYC